MQTVAAGILQDIEGRVFVQQRKDGRWEFPGGKSEKGESPMQTLARELAEETGITTKDATPWLRRALPDAGIVLHFFRVNQWRGIPRGCEGQECYFCHLDAPPEPMLAANIPVWKWLKLPPLCAITAAELMGVEESLKSMKNAFTNGLRLVQLRDKNLPPQIRRSFAEQAAAMARKHKAILLINDDETLARDINADGVHLSSVKLAEAKCRPDFAWAAASCHNSAQLQMAASLNLDFAVLSPVAKTLTHVDAAPMGWNGFAKLAANTGIPVYALGGLSKTDIQTARRHNAQGAALMRKAWQ
ncbi:MAG: Nudix family hydrolase [Gammaproteobacteria bacterium]